MRPTHRIKCQVLVATLLAISAPFLYSTETFSAPEDEPDGGNAQSSESGSDKYMGKAPRLAVGEVRKLELPDIWPENRRPPTSVNNCLLCHLTVGGAYTFSTIDYAESTHDNEHLSCEMCHGGDTTDDEYSHARRGYIGTHPGNSGKRCADCHWLSAETYEASAHYRAQYDWRYPRCYDCHGEHAVGKGEVSMADACTSCHGGRATGMSGNEESAIIWKSPSKGSYGNDISIELRADGADSELSIEHHVGDGGTQIIVHLETDSDGQAISAAEEIIDLVTDMPELLQVIYCEEGDGYLGEDVAEPTPPFKLRGGADFDAKYPNYSDLIRGDDDLWESLRLLNKRWKERPPELVAAVTALKKQSMELVHASKVTPDPADVERVIRETIRLKEMMKRHLRNQSGGALNEDRS